MTFSYVTSLHFTHSHCCNHLAAHWLASHHGTLVQPQIAGAQGWKTPSLIRTDLYFRCCLAMWCREIHLPSLSLHDFGKTVWDSSNEATPGTKEDLFVINASDYSTWSRSALPQSSTEALCREPARVLHRYSPASASARPSAPLITYLKTIDSLGCCWEAWRNRMSRK